MTRSLVTGAAGFIGSHVARHCLDLGHEVVYCRRPVRRVRRERARGTRFVTGSVSDPAFVDSLFERSPFDFVYHLAAYAAEGLSHFIRRFNYTNNVIGSVNLINERRPTPKSSASSSPARSRSMARTSFR